MVDTSWFELSARDGAVMVRHERSAKDEAEAHAVLAAMDAWLNDTGLELLIIDSREADRTPPDVAAIIWKWLESSVHLKKVATLMHSRELSRKVRETSAANGVRLKTFSDEAKARVWLHQP